MSEPSRKFSAHLRKKAISSVLNTESQYGSRWQAILFISAEIGCSPQTLKAWVAEAEVSTGNRASIQISLAEKVKSLESENRELRATNELLREAAAYYFAISHR